MSDKAADGLGKLDVHGYDRGISTLIEEINDFDFLNY